MRKLIPVLLMCCTAAQAVEKDKVYRYTDAKGVVHYTDKPPAKDAQPVDLPPLQTFPAGGRADLSTPSAAPKKAVAFSLAITSPAPGDTFRDTDSAISIEVSVTPPMPQGYGMKFASDGTPLHEGVLEQTSFSVGGLERGSHTLTATLFDQDGNERGSASVTVNVKQPIAKPGAK